MQEIKRMDAEKKKVCVTGSSGYLGSSVVKHLLERGYIVHATLRNLGDSTKVGLLKALPYADKNLLLFQADIYNPHEFEAAIQGCEAVLHLATPFQHNFDSNSQYKNTTEAAVGGVKIIAESSIRSGTVKQLIYTASIVATSPLKEDGNGYKDSMDETCWTPLNLSFPYSNDFLVDYVHSKTLAEKELLKYNGEKLKVVSIVCGLVGGDTVKSTASASMRVLLAQMFRNKILYHSLRFMEELSGKIPIVHIHDVNAAHSFCLENSHINGRFLCVAAFLKTSEIAALVHKYQPDIKIEDDEFVEDTMREINLGSSKKLEKYGFQYKYDAEMIVMDTVRFVLQISSSSSSKEEEFLPW